MLEPLLNVEGLDVSFGSQNGLLKVVENVSFHVNPGEILCIVGESGSGKTVSLLSVLGLIDPLTSRVAGSALFKGEEILGRSQKELRRIRGREIGFISQDPMTALTPVHTIGWQITEQLRTHTGLSNRAAWSRAIELLGEVGIPSPRQLVERYPHQLSGGMRQRAVIAMALSCNPALLIADEPTTALDVTVQAQVLDLLHRLRKDFGSSIVLITHDMGVVAEMADRVMVMYAGRVVEHGPRDPVFLEPWHPYTWGLLNSIPPLAGPRPDRLVSIPGAPPQPGHWPIGCKFAPRCHSRFEACSMAPPWRETNERAALCFLNEAERTAARASNVSEYTPS
ncbi:ABC transporter ATP-binding protein [Agrobacterium vitis]